MGSKERPMQQAKKEVDHPGGSFPEREMPALGAQPLRACHSTSCGAEPTTWIMVVRM